MEALEQSLKILNILLPSFQKAMTTIQNATTMEIAKLDKGEKDKFTSIMEELKNCKTSEQHAAITEKLTKLQKQYAR